MVHPRIRWLALAVAFGLTSPARAQFGLPGTSALPAVPTAGSAAAAPAAPKTIWGFLGLTKANHAACKEKLCGSQVGQLLNNGLKPISLLSGSIVPEGFCPTLPPPPPGAAQAGPAGPDGAQSAAGAVAQDQAAAPARIAAIEYLATVDCHYWPEATAALIGRLRGDRVECVRFAAARALATGCCCTSKTVEALANVLTDKPDDKFPSENSERVKATAYVALQRCMACMVEDDKPPQIPPESPEVPNLRPLDLPDTVVPTSAIWGVSGIAVTYHEYYERTLSSRSSRQILANARRALARAADAKAIAPTPRMMGSLSITDAIARATPSPNMPTSVSQRAHQPVEDKSWAADDLNDIQIAEGRERVYRAANRNKPLGDGRPEVTPVRRTHRLGYDPSVKTATHAAMDGKPSDSQSFLGMLRRSIRAD